MLTTILSLVVLSLSTHTCAHTANQSSILYYIGRPDRKIGKRRRKKKLKQHLKTTTFFILIQLDEKNCFKSIDFVYDKISILFVGKSELLKEAISPRNLDVPFFLNLISLMWLSRFCFALFYLFFVSSLTMHQDLQRYIK